MQNTGGNSRHIQWIDKVYVMNTVFGLTISSHHPLVQGTPPLSRPLHRENIAVKPCMDSPDLHTKEQLAEQRSAMIEIQRQKDLKERERMWTRLF